MKPGSSKTEKAVILLSGGIDSSTTLAIARHEGYKLYAMSFDYRQRHRRELLSAKMVAEALGVKEHLVVSFDLGDIGGSALTTGMKVPKARGREGKKFVHPSRIPLTYVPARNTIFLSFGLAWAEVLGAEKIYIGATAVDYSGYPDCRPEYIEAFEKMANLATKASVEGKLTFRISAPLIALKKSEIIRRGMALGLNYGLTWSCYDPRTRTVRRGFSKALNRLPEADSSENDLIPCGKCDSCVFRKMGFRDAGAADPLLSIAKR